MILPGGHLECHAHDSMRRLDSVSVSDRSNVTSGQSYSSGDQPYSPGKIPRINSTSAKSSQRKSGSQASRSSME